MTDEKSFTAKDGQVDFTNIRWCPVINCLVKYKNTFLLVKRSENMRLYPGYWNGISGFLDDDKNIDEKVEEELREELGIEKENIISIQLGGIFDQEAAEYEKTWIVHPVFVEISTDTITLDFEAQEYIWLSFEEIRKYKLLPGFDHVVEKFTYLFENKKDL